MGLVSSKRPAREVFKPLDDEDKAIHAKKYTPEQLVAIAAGEEAIDPEDLNERGTLRSDWGHLDYLDDFGTIRPTLDRKARREGPVDPEERLMDYEEYEKRHIEFISQLMEKGPTITEGLDIEDPEVRVKLRPNNADILRAFDEVPDLVGSNGPLKGDTFLAPGLPRDFAKDDPEAEPKRKEEEVDDRDPDGKYDLIRKQTGLTLDEIMDLKMKVLVTHYVTNQTRLGKIQSKYALAIAGNGDGVLGIGQAKGQESADAYHNARVQAIRNMRPIPRYESRTIYGEVDAKVSAVEVKLMSRPPGFGLRCQHLIFEMARAAGIQDLAARVPRSRNKMNTVKAAYLALMKQRIPDEVARGRGKKLVDVRKVYYAGRV